HLLYLPFLLVLWAALRLPLIQALSINLLVAAIAICGTLHDFADATRPQLLYELAFLYLYLLTQSATVLLVAGVVRDREKTANELLQAQRNEIGRASCRATW